MPRPSSTGRVSPLFVFGAVLTAAGTALYLHPGPGLPLLARRFRAGGNGGGLALGPAALSASAVRPSTARMPPPLLCLGIRAVLGFPVP